MKFSLSIRPAGYSPKSRVAVCGTFLCDFAETWRALREKPIFHAKLAKISKAAERSSRLRHYPLKQTLDCRFLRVLRSFLGPLPEAPLRDDMPAPSMHTH